MLGFAFLPAGLKKVLGQPFTDPANQGAFHDFLHAFHATGFFYRFVGAIQLLAAVMLISQIFPAYGALLIAPVLVAIFVFCWSTMVVPTAIVVSFMLLGLSFLLLWDSHKWNLFPSSSELNEKPDLHPIIDRRIWRIAGISILILYFVDFGFRGEVYRPRVVDFSDPSFIVLLIIAIIPVIAFVVDYRRSLRR